MLKSLEIKNFRILKDFQVHSLGRVNLIVGKNNSGKSSVLEALRIYAGNANHILLRDIAEDHDEIDDIPFKNFFFGREFPQDKTPVISIGEMVADDDALRIEYGFYIEEKIPLENDSERLITKKIRIQDPSNNELSLDEINHALFIKKGERLLSTIPLNGLDFKHTYSFFKNKYIKSSETIACSMVPTQFISIDDLADDWDNIVFTENEGVVKDALRIIEPNFENLTFVRNDSDRADLRRKLKRFAKVKLSDLPHPVPSIVWEMACYGCCN